MNISIATVGSRGDVQPYIALGRELQARGHRVQVVTDGLFEPFVRGAGLGFAPIDANPQKVLQADDVSQVGSSPIRLIQWIDRNARPLARRLFVDLKQACQGADLLLFSVLALAAPHVAEALRIPSLAAYLQPVTPTQAFPNPALGQLPAGLPFRGWLNWLSFRQMNLTFFWMVRGTLNVCRREVLGLRPLPWRAYAGLDVGRQPILYGFSPALLPKPPDWGDWLHVTGFWFLDEDDTWQPPADLARFLDAGPPPVYVGFGSMIERDAPGLTRLVIAALRQTGQRGILLGGWSGLGEGDLPATVLPLAGAPHGWLFPRMAAVVHHGGAGTTAAALRAGVPSVAVPYFADQSFWGWRAHLAGAASRPIPRKRLTPERLAAALKDATGSSVRQGAAGLGRRVRAENGVGTAVDLVERYVERTGVIETVSPRASA